MTVFHILRLKHEITLYYNRRASMHCYSLHKGANFTFHNANTGVILICAMKISEDSLMLSARFYKISNNNNKALRCFPLVSGVLMLRNMISFNHLTFVTLTFL